MSGLISLKFPAGRTHISLKEGAEILEPLLPEPPLLERLKASIEHLPTEDERRRSIQAATKNGDIETYERLRVLDSREDAAERYADIAGGLRKADHLPKAMLAVARERGIPLLHPTLGISPGLEPTVEWFVDETGFRKIAEPLLQPANLTERMLDDLHLGERIPNKELKGDKVDQPEELEIASSPKKRKNYRSQLFTIMTRLAKNGELPNSDGDVEPVFRRIYERQMKEKGWPALPQRRAIIEQVKQIRPQIPKPAPNAQERPTTARSSN